MVDDKLYVARAANNSNGEKAVTYYTTIKRANGYSLVELDLGNNRKEQIRHHMQELGHPIVGDTRYDAENDPLNRMALHAFYLSFHHPVTGEFLKFETSHPANFSNLFTSQQ
jgi:23S rRNA pseudouridine1911/1915/1917 synthase